MKSIRLALFCVLLIPAISASGQTDYLADPYWNSGKAEFQVYDAKIEKYGIRRNATVKLIFVKEPFDKEKLVKTRLSADPMDIIKMNMVRIIPAGIYDYFQMASVFFDRNSGRVVKYAMSSQDGCGTTSMTYRFRENSHRFGFSSYFDDQGDSEAIIDQENFVFYDALPMVLRFKLKNTRKYTFKMVASLISNKRQSIEVHRAEVSAKVVNPFRAGEKQYDRIHAVTVESKGLTDVFYFETAYPNRLIKWEKGNGDVLVLRRSGFLYYWNYTGPEHADMPK